MCKYKSNLAVIFQLSSFTRAILFQVPHSGEPINFNLFILQTVGRLIYPNKIIMSQHKSIYAAILQLSLFTRAVLFQIAHSGEPINFKLFISQTEGRLIYPNKIIMSKYKSNLADILQLSSFTRANLFQVTHSGEPIFFQLFISQTEGRLIFPNKIIMSQH